MATASHTYAAASHTNLDTDLSPVVTIPNGITQVNFVGVAINSSNGASLTFSNPAMLLTVIWYKSVDNGVTYNEFCRFDATGGAVNKGGTRVDPSAEFHCDPPLLPGTLVKIHVTQTGTYWLGGTLTADYTP